MPLANYGVCVGTRPRGEDPEQGEWYHGVFTVEGGGQQYTCTVDLESQLQAEVQYAVLATLPVNLFSPILALSDGYHDLATNPQSGALDYIRSPFLTARGCLTLFAGLLNAIFGTNIPWTTTTGQDAVNVLIPLVTAPV